MIFLWRCLLLVFTIYFLTSGQPLIWFAVPFIALLMGSLRNDIVTQLIHLDRNERTRFEQLKGKLNK